MRNRLRLFITLLASAIITTVLFLGPLERQDQWVQDSLYQLPHAVNGQIVIIGIDEKSLNELGPYNTWNRGIFADALEILAKDPEHQPSVTAIDILFSGESDPVLDRRLATAAGKLGHVITASLAELGPAVVRDPDGTYYLDRSAVLSYAEPYEMLRQNTAEGHANAVYDVDGVLRHMIAYLDIGGRRVDSLAYTAAKMYAESIGGSVAPPPTDSLGIYYLPYSGKPGAYSDGLSVSDLIKGNIPSDFYAGKIVLIGPYAAGLQDSHLTPIARGQQMFGVEAQANAIDAILAGNYKKEAKQFLQAVAVFLLSALLMWCFLQISVLKSGIIALTAAGFSVAAACFLYEYGLIIHPTWLPVSIVSMYLISVVTHYITAAMEKAKVRKAFERYVAPEVVGELLKEGTDALGLGGKPVRIAVLFVDIRGFTSMSERLNPEEVVYILNRYLSMTSTCVEKNRGTLDKFVGDCTMAFWGAPLPIEDPVYLAVKCAKDIADGAAELSKELLAETGEPLRVGVGVNYGPAVVGNIGSERHMDYTAIGDTVNTAARLEANAPSGMIYVSRTVADALRGKAEFESLGDTIKLKGKAEGFEVLRLKKLMLPEKQQEVCSDNI